jgi:lipid-binding SYLF domain-containing protein
VDLFMLVMNEAGAKRLLRSEFKIGGEASAMAGPVGRSVQANTDAYMRAEMLSWSRSRGAFAGIALEGTTLREDMDDNKALYGRALTNEQIIHGGSAKMPVAAKPLISQLSRYSFREK